MSLSTFGRHVARGPFRWGSDWGAELAALLRSPRRTWGWGTQRPPISRYGELPPPERVHRGGWLARESAWGLPRRLRGAGLGASARRCRSGIQRDRFRRRHGRRPPADLHPRQRAAARGSPAGGQRVADRTRAGVVRRAEPAGRRGADVAGGRPALDPRPRRFGARDGPAGVPHGRRGRRAGRLARRPRLRLLLGVD